MNTHTSKTAWFVAAILVGAGAVAVGSYLLSGSDDEATSEIRIRVGVEASLLPAAVFVAEQRGLFEQEGVDVELTEYSSGRAAFQDMLAGTVDIATVAPTPIMFSSFEREDFSVLASFVHSYDDVKVIGRADVGIGSPADLSGRRVGTPAGTTGQFFLAAFLTRSGVPHAEVEMVDIAPPDLPAALTDGVVDAIVIWEPHASAALAALGDNAVRLPTSDIYKETFNFTVMNDFAQNHPEALVRFTGAAVEATEFIREHEAEAQQLVADRIGQDVETLAALWGEFEYGVTLEHSLVLVLEEEATWAVANDLVEADSIPNYDLFIYAHALEAVLPEAVGLLR